MQFFKLFSLPMFLLLFVSVFFISACSDDETNEQTNHALIGSWQWVINERFNCPTPEDEGSIPLTDCSDYCYHIVFNTDGTADVTVNNEGSTFSGTGTYTYADNILTVCVTQDGTEYCDSGPVTINSDTSFTLFMAADEEGVCDVNRIFEKK